MRDLLVADWLDREVMRVLIGQRCRRPWVLIGQADRIPCVLIGWIAVILHMLIGQAERRVPCADWPGDQKSMDVDWPSRRVPLGADWLGDPSFCWLATWAPSSHVDWPAASYRDCWPDGRIPPAAC